MGGGKSPNPLTPNAIQNLTNSSPPTETLTDINARVAEISGRMDSLIATTLHIDIGDDSFTSPAMCSGTKCTFDFEGETYPYELDDLFDLSVSAPILSKNGVTTIKAKAVNDYNNYGAWLNHSAFGVEVVVAGDAIVRAAGAGGDLTGSKPITQATWKGLMVGTPTAGGDKGDSLQGDALLTYDVTSSLLDAKFTDIKNIDKLRAYSTSTVSFDDIPVSSNGTYQSGSIGNRISGGFYGPDHAEAAGIFEQQGISGAFGATKTAN